MGELERELGMDLLGYSGGYIFFFLKLAEIRWCSTDKLDLVYCMVYEFNSYFDATHRKVFFLAFLSFFLSFFPPLCTRI